MDSDESSRKCSKCGSILFPRAKFCTRCGTKAEVKIHCPSCNKELEEGTSSCPFCGTSVSDLSSELPDQKRVEEVQQPVQEPLEAPRARRPTQFDSTLDQGLKFFTSLRDNLSNAIVVLGAFSIIAAVALIIIILLPKDFVSDIEIPPLEGIIFDSFVILGLLALVVKELLVYLGYIPKKETLDRWLSLVLILICWTNLITFSIGLVDTSLLYQLGLKVPAIFLLLAIENLMIGFFYFRRYQETLFSGTFIIVIMSVIYLLQWIIPIEPIFYTTLVILTTFGIVGISRLVKDMILFIGLTILLPLMFFSPYLLSNSIVIIILSLLVIFPFIEAFLERSVIKDSEGRDIIMKSLGEFCSTFGMLNVAFSVFYGHLDPVFSLVLLSIPVLGFLGLKIGFPIFRKLPLRDLSTAIFLVFTLVFFDFVVKNLLILFGISVLLILYTTFTFLEYSTIELLNYRRYSELLLVTSLIAISLTRMEFLWKNALLIIPMFTFLIYIYQKKPINTFTVRGFVFGSELLILMAFLRSPFFDWLIIPTFSIILILGLLFLIISYENKFPYSLNLTIFSLIFEATLLVMMLWTKTSNEMLYPVFLLVIMAILISFIQLLQKTSPNFFWLNSTFIVCFGLMTYWNEFEPIMTILITSLLILPTLLVIILSRGIQDSLEVETITKNQNLNISLSALGLALVVFFEELDPISHSLLFLVGPIIWMVLILFEKRNPNTISVLSILTYPAIIFICEMMLKETIFTPITDNTYLYLTLITLAIPAITLQIEQFIRKKDQTIINPLIIGTALVSLILLVAFSIYEFQPIEPLILVLGVVVAVLISMLLIKWQYESIILILISFFPSTLYAGYYDLPSFLALYLIPIFPILLNFVMGLKFMKTALSVKLHEFSLLGYFVVFILVSPIRMIEYTTALFALFHVSWLVLTILTRKLAQKIFILTNMVNSILVLILMVLIDPLIPDSFISELGFTFSIKTTLICLILIILILVIIFHILGWQVSEINVDLSYLMTFILIFNSSAFVLSAIQLMIRLTEVPLSSVVFGILLVSTILLVTSIISYRYIGRLKTEVSLAWIFAASTWVILSSFYFDTFELVFFWLILAPIMVLVFLATREKSMILIGFIFYLIAGLRLIEHFFEFLLSGTADWLTILGLIVFGVELVSLGIYSSVSGRNNNVNGIVQEVKEY
ncbi:MAG: zinc ribbon domain-containing protein [Promethearchaeota archaeon]